MRSLLIRPLLRVRTVRGADSLKLASPTLQHVACRPNGRRALRRTFAALSGPRLRAAYEEEALKLLRAVHDPLIPDHGDIVSIGMAKVRCDADRQTVSVVLELHTAAHPEREALRDECMRTLRAGLPWAREVDVQLRPMRPRSNVLPGGAAGSGDATPSIDGLAHVGCAIAVSSCKGGVGKSTVAANLAFALAAAGGRVGLLDADVYGPSLPSLIRPASTALRASPTNDRMVRPIEHEGVSCLSFGYVNPAAGVPGAGASGGVGGAAVMRGAIVSRVVTQLAVATEVRCCSG
jgi:metal-sulfur cluster biosynthetic enzyme